jgi:hypothetical protein
VLLSVVQVTDGQFVASSPDERAIMEACFHHGLVYNGELADGRLSVTVQGNGTLLLILCREAKARFSPCFGELGNIKIAVKNIFSARRIQSFFKLRHPEEGIDICSDFFIL